MKITQFSVWGLLEHLDRRLSVLWETLIGAAKPLVVSASDNAVRADSPQFSQRKAFSGSDSTDGYLMLVENGLYRRMTLSKSVTTVGPSEEMDYRLADSGEGCLEFFKRNDRYYVQGRNPTGGACLNGERLSADELKELKPLDKIQIAHTTLIFLAPDAAPKRSKEAGTL